MCKEKQIHYQSRGARAMVFLHEHYLREFFEVWKKAKTRGVALPETSHSADVSFEMLLQHVFECVRHLMEWMCEKLELSDPKISPEPLPEVIEAQAEQYLEHLLRQWRTPLAGIEEKRFDEPEYMSRLGMQCCISSMLEHAVIHPIQHCFQLEELLEKQYACP